MQPVVCHHRSSANLRARLRPQRPRPGSGRAAGHHSPNRWSRPLRAAARLTPATAGIDGSRPAPERGRTQPGRPPAASDAPTHPNSGAREKLAMNRNRASLSWAIWARNASRSRPRSSAGARRRRTATTSATGRASGLAAAGRATYGGPSLRAPCFAPPARPASAPRSPRSRGRRMTHCAGNRARPDSAAPPATQRPAQAAPGSGRQRRP